jgi:hypothetical protein
MSTIKVDTIKNTSNVEVFTCKAWVNFDGTTNTGGTCTIRASGNVTSVTDLSTGDYRVNFTTAMADANYCAVGSTLGSTIASYATYLNSSGTALSTTSCTVEVRNSVSDATVDSDVVCVAVFR